MGVKKNGHTLGHSEEGQQRNIPLAGKCKRHRDRQSSRTEIVIAVSRRVRRFSWDRPPSGCHISSHTNRHRSTQGIARSLEEPRKPGTPNLESRAPIHPTTPPSKPCRRPRQANPPHSNLHPEHLRV